MVTAAQIIANRSNAQHSTGPRTEEGKKASAANATVTGLTSAQIFVRPEDAEIFTKFEAGLLSEFQPVGVNQDHLFTLILHASWNIRRCYALEAEIQNEAIAKGISDALLDDELSRKLDRIYRYKKMHESSYRRAVGELRQLQTEEVWRRENGELTEEPVLVKTASVLTALYKRCNLHTRAEERNIEAIIEKKRAEQALSV